MIASQQPESVCLAVLASQAYTFESALPPADVRQRSLAPSGSHELRLASLGRSSSFPCAKRKVWENNVAAGGAF